MSNDQMARPGMAGQSLADVRGQAPLEVEADDYYFSPAEIHGASGQTLTFEVSNESRTLHNFSIPGAGDRQGHPARCKG